MASQEWCGLRPSFLCWLEHSRRTVWCVYDTLKGCVLCQARHWGFCSSHCSLVNLITAVLFNYITVNLYVWASSASVVYSHSDAVLLHIAQFTDRNICQSWWMQSSINQLLQLQSNRPQSHNHCYWFIRDLSDVCFRADFRFKHKATCKNESHMSNGSSSNILTVQNIWLNNTQWKIWGSLSFLINLPIFLLTLWKMWVIISQSPRWHIYLGVLGLIGTWTIRSEIFVWLL